MAYSLLLLHERTSCLCLSFDIRLRRARRDGSERRSDFVYVCVRLCVRPCVSSCVCRCVLLNPKSFVALLDTIPIAMGLIFNQIWAWYECESRHCLFSNIRQEHHMSAVFTHTAAAHELLYASIALLLVHIHVHYT